MSNKDKKHCEKCDKELDEIDIYELDGLTFCSDCFNEKEDLNAISEEWI
jgi:hypothetical protein